MPSKPELEPKDEAAARRYLTKGVMSGRELQTRFQKGRSGNPQGRKPKPDNLTDMLIYVLGKRGMEDLADKLIALAKNEVPENAGKVPYNVQLQAINDIYDRIEGKPRQTVMNKNEGEHPLITLLRELTDPGKALEGHELAPGTLAPIGPVIDGEAVPVTGEAPGPDVRRE